MILLTKKKSRDSFCGTVNFGFSYVNTYIETVPPPLYNIMGDIQRMSTGTAIFAHRS